MLCALTVKFMAIKNKEDVAQALSARINEAYQSLLKPLARVEYILDRNGRPISETDSVDDPVFFAEVMQVMEDIDEAEEEQALEQISKLNDGWCFLPDLCRWRLTQLYREHPSSTWRPRRPRFEAGLGEGQGRCGATQVFR